MNEWTQSNHIVLTVYPGYAGGKFLINCLGFHDLCFPTVALDHSDTVETCLARKIQTSFNTIPSSKIDCLNWTQYERSCGDYWGFGAPELLENPEVLSRTYPLAKQILNDYYVFLVVHSAPSALELKKIFPNAQILELINVINFVKIAYKLKTGQDAPWQSMTNQNCGDFQFDIDTIFNWDDFYKELVRCVEWLGLEPKFDPRLKDFYSRYISLHQ